MSSKAEKTFHHSHQQPRLSIFFRNPLLLKIVAWLSSLSFLGTTGVVWADIKPISTSKTEAPELIQASASAVEQKDRETYGPYLPIAQEQPSIRVAPDQLPNREVPLAVAAASAVILPTGTIVRPQHTDLSTADNYTVSVNESTSGREVAEEFINIPVPAPLSSIIPGRNREIVTITKSQIQPSYTKTQTAIGQSVPATSIQRQESANSYRSVPAVPTLPTAASPSIGRSRSSISASVAIDPNVLKGTQGSTFTPQYVPLAGLKRTVVAPMKPQIAARASEVKPVARLPQLTANKVVPIVPAIPSVRPGAVAASQSKPIAFVNIGENESNAELIYPLSSPAPTTSSFGWRTHPITGNRRFHSGVDIGAPMGAPVVAAGSGTIISSGWLGGYGKAIVIQHNGVQQTLYGHLSEVFVQPGQRIEQGTVIGRVGSTGNSTGPHLHFESRMATSDGWVAVDPGDDIKYALDNLRRSAPFAQRDLPPGYN
ncbi:peptidoglycan DD-metalloendopeptidase family protein [Chamaesiphon sp. VAR_48_metabat_135_sub]|uniref:peptidoglycan DD-metalloendopeptidase family protein n=1 Tax=Chamaesiphon sp. VAR_48_metabat_135_sub TaxID=2964699 RepID=UPI00286B4801|nr:peptidoglycan DD-metalloendopeptidase family protein [Chamaesiphon sp. VAR_48_metabat_135_sub]